MRVILRTDADERQLQGVTQKLRALGHAVRAIPQGVHVALALGGRLSASDSAALLDLPGVQDIVQSDTPEPLALRINHPADTIVRVGGVEFGGRGLALIAGPCAIESRAQAMTIAARLRDLGVGVMRGGAYKPRTSPYSFQGLGPDGLRILADVRAETGMAIVSEAMTPEDVETVEAVVDAIQVGARNMHNYALLKRLGATRKPVLLKRGMAATVEEWVSAAEYILAGGNRNVILCERGIRTFNDYSRFTLDIGVVPELKSLTHLPVIVDPSHAAGRIELVIPLAKAAIAAGADGVMVEVHHQPELALSDGRQSLSLEQFEAGLDELHNIARAVNRPISIAVDGVTR